MATITSVLSTDNLSQGRAKLNANFTNLNTDKLEFSQNGDFYKYSISRTVSSGNLTITLLNYLGATPSASAPVKVQIGGVVRTITSALSLTVNAGASYYNLGSAELATKETDLFTYLFYYTTSGGGAKVDIAISRIPNGNTTADFYTATSLNEKSISFNFNTSLPASTDQFVNIGRFSAILSAGAGYIWSVPATSVIVNRPIYETRWLTAASTVTSTSGTLTSASGLGQYKISCDTLYFAIISTITTAGTGSGATNITLPFSTNVTSVYIGGGRIEGGLLGGNQVQIKNQGGVTATLFTYNNLATVADSSVIHTNGFYQI